jgi:hypothetical protein
MNRLERYLDNTPPTSEALRARAREVLEFCEIIIRIHEQAGEPCGRQPEGLSDLILWANDTLQRLG